MVPPNVGPVSVVRRPVVVRKEAEPNKLKKVVAGVVVPVDEAQARVSEEDQALGKVEERVRDEVWPAGNVNRIPKRKALGIQQKRKSHRPFPRQSLTASNGDPSVLRT